MEGINLVINEILEGSEAERVGLKKGDIILKYNDRVINGDLQLFSTHASDDQKVPLVVLRNLQSITFTVKGGKLGIDIRRPDKNLTSGFWTLNGYAKFVSGTGWVIIGLAGLAFLGGLMSGEDFGFIISFGAVGFMIMGIYMIVTGQMISCFISIEKNTRHTYEAIKEKFP